ncbi:CIS tube protein [Corallococcus aberystwythensis]|uniref:LysM peptidoglycan-binding domain-containing protein n=1 Tax=Corallococcus aberystwythensis TaxID=2316722 RepID=A0A3A8PWZ4_9BACT|nr:LysM peptidoglycan-binding domain-containing protein [Corallococcus aberystwythensis]RKH59550.1 LysM peptidoglycan-binding domain-containing protein [Corallococcus aberystwythensis]
MSGELKKLKIEAYRAISYAEGEKQDTFSVLFNPASYASKYEIEYGQGQGQGTSGSSQRFGRIKPREYIFELVFDGTGTAASPREVATDIEQFLTVTGKMDGEIHRPLYLKLSWGPLIVRCVLKAADIQYSLFKPDGFPLRARVTAVFSEAIDDTLRVAEQGLASPDVTHERVVRQGDTLPLMVHRVYGSAAHTVDVARFNGLRHLRDLRPGQVLRLPPLVRQSS